MGKGLVNGSVMKEYTKKRKPLKKAKFFKIKDPHKDNKMITFPLHLKELIETVYPSTMNNAVNHHDNLTGFNWTYGRQQNPVGESRKSRGITMIAKTKVEKIHSFVFISKRGIRIDPKYRSNLAKFGYYPHGSSVYTKDCAGMKVNTRSMSQNGLVEKENVVLENLSAKTLRETYKFDIEGTKQDMHVVLRNVLPIEINDELIVRNYGNKSKMPFGQEYYVKAQSLCQQEYQRRKLNTPVNRTLCFKCFEMMPYFKTQHRTHNLTCNGPYIWNFLAPVDSIEDSYASDEGSDSEPEKEEEGLKVDDEEEEKEEEEEEGLDD